MIVRRVTRVRLTRNTEPTPADHTSYPGTELWRVECAAAKKSPRRRWDCVVNVGWERSGTTPAD